MEKKSPKDKEEISIEEAFRSLGKFFSWLDERISPSSEFREHMAKSRIEFLKGIRVLIDKRVDDLEKRHSKKAGKKATRVKVE
ncbi:MAG: hypothetical protein JRF06_03930 [Deltaproteobacteria bacterium]|nr:hypothetical protein [Deltaproteobacteria bacterium]MBW2334234.1 hypothetical protein [Deltaproteobacteria bacterium]